MSPCLPSRAVRYGTALSTAAAALLLCATLPHPIRGADAASAGAASEEDASERKATVGLVRGQALVGRLLADTVTVRTRYGTLEVPADELVRIRLRPRLEASAREAILERIRARASEDGGGKLTEKDIATLRSYGTRAYPVLLEASREVDDPEGLGLQALIEAMRGDEDVYLGPQDEVITERFTMLGEVTDERFEVSWSGRTITVPRRDIVHVTYRALEVRKVFEVSPRNRDQDGFLQTEIELRKNQEFSLEPSGSMTWDGKTFGPAGIGNHRWNGRNVGCLQWRIGSGAWKILSEKFEGKAESAGELQLSVHLYNTNGSGEFRVLYRTQKKP